MATTEYTGRHQLVKRLTAQMGDEGKAIALFKARGQMDAKGNLTAAGRARDAMTAEERAKDRAAKASGKPAAKYKYNAKTNSATLKGKR